MDPLPSLPGAQHCHGGRWLHPPYVGENAFSRLPRSPCTPIRHPFGFPLRGPPDEVPPSSAGPRGPPRGCTCARFKPCGPWFRLCRSHVISAFHRSCTRGCASGLHQFGPPAYNNSGLVQRGNVACSSHGAQARPRRAEFGATGTRRTTGVQAPTQNKVCSQGPPNQPRLGSHLPPDSGGCRVETAPASEGTPLHGSRLRGATHLGLLPPAATRATWPALAGHASTYGPEVCAALASALAR